MTAPSINTHHLTIATGKHAGELYTRLPVGYLRWMINVGHSEAPTAQAELDRRGTIMPTLDVSAHAIDRASLQALDIWQATRKPDEGIAAWVHRIASEALHVEPRAPGRYVWGPLELAIETDLAWPIVKTLIYNPRAAGVPSARNPDHPGHRPDHARTAP